MKMYLEEGVPLSDDVGVADCTGGICCAVVRYTFRGLHLDLMESTCMLLIIIIKTNHRIHTLHMLSWVLNVGR